MSWLRWLLAAGRAVLALARVFSAWRHRREGRIEARKDQLEEDHERLRRAADARRGVDASADGVRRDPRNRDAR